MKRDNSVYVVFTNYPTGDPSRQPRFIEAEDCDGKGMRFEWEQHPQHGRPSLVIPRAPVSEARAAAVRELVKVANTIIYEGGAALDTHRYTALRDAVWAIEEAG